VIRRGHRLDRPRCARVRLKTYRERRRALPSPCVLPRHARPHGSRPANRGHWSVRRDRLTIRHAKCRRDCCVRHVPPPPYVRPRRVRPNAIRREHRKQCCGRRAILKQCCGRRLIRSRCCGHRERLSIRGWNQHA
jgi:hypothetical protein